MTTCFFTEAFKKRLMLLFFIILLLIALVGGIIIGSTSCYAVYGDTVYSLRAATLEGHHAFAEQFGLTLSHNPVMIQKVRIPSDFNTVYQHYNKLQQSVGLDLLPYSGKKCTLYTYQIVDPAFPEETVLHLLILNGKVIGGDISETTLTGRTSSFCQSAELLS